MILRAEARRSASMMISSSIRLSFAGKLVDWMTNTSSPRTFSWISTKISWSAKRRTAHWARSRLEIGGDRLGEAAVGVAGDDLHLERRSSGGLPARISAGGSRARRLLAAAQCDDNRRLAAATPTAPSHACSAALTPRREGGARALVVEPSQPNRSRASLAPSPSAFSLANAMSHCIGAMPQLVQGKIRSRGTIAHRLLDRRRDLFRRLDLIARDVDDADQHVLALQKPDQLHRHARILRLDRNLLDAALGDRRKNLLVLPPLASRASPSSRDSP